MAGTHQGVATGWFWVLGALVVALAVALVVVLVTRDDDDTKPAATTTTTTATTTTTDAPRRRTTATTTTAPPTTTTVALPVITDDPQTYAEYLFASWQNNNRTDAANVASADAVTQMFAQAYPAQGALHVLELRPRRGIALLHVERPERRDHPDAGAHAHRRAADPGAGGDVLTLT